MGTQTHAREDDDRGRAQAGTWARGARASRGLGADSGKCKPSMLCDYKPIMLSLTKQSRYNTHGNPNIFGESSSPKLGDRLVMDLVSTVSKRPQNCLSM